ncbi:MAG TPA: 7,8-didemethyl-8-hydroxy-5-deazariboflavin synthase subunit CofG [Methanotrichaceae archaeon]|nr:7,8-didemethyl-8-hydroxy-5-deazariboflavin synthase subunit CofG [Methanotrichaceae archaeon]
MRLLTYSRNVFIPVTDLCRNRCGYCSFRREPKDARIVSRPEALHLLERAAAEGCSEALFSLGESPWVVEGFQRLLDAAGISDLVDYLVELCELALEMGLLPHTNAGVLSDDCLLRLAPYNASMGMMLETTAHVAAHANSPGKRPDLRLDFIAKAGKMKIPFTTGILVGIGESREDRQESLQAIADLHRSYGHIQEVIIQPLDPKPGTALASASVPGMDELCETVGMAREILPEGVALQIPPNLVDPLPLVRAGANDLGGLSTVTPDWINPERPWPGLDDLRLRLRGYTLRERLPVYPRFVLQGWYGEKTCRQMLALAGEDGLRRKEYL